MYIFVLLPYLIYAQDETIVKVDVQDNSEVFIIVDEPPEFNGGDKALQKFYKKNSKFKIAKDRKDGLTVYFQIVVSKEGSISDLKFLRSPSRELELELEKLVGSMPNWIPGKKEGKLVKVKVVQEVSFIL